MVDWLRLHGFSEGLNYIPGAMGGGGGVLRRTLGVMGWILEGRKTCV